MGQNSGHFCAFLCSKLHKKAEKIFKLLPNRIRGAKPQIIKHRPERSEIRRYNKKLFTKKTTYASVREFFCLKDEVRTLFDKPSISLRLAK